MNKRLFFLIAAGLCAGSVHANVVITPFATGLFRSTTITGNTHLAGDQRVFVLSKTGMISQIDKGTGTVSTFLDLSAETYSEKYDERGLLGMTFDPHYATNGRFYVFMTTQPVAGGAIYEQVRRYTDPAIASEASELIWQNDVTDVTNHVAGWIDFDKSGKLLIAIGDGGNGTASDIRHTGQDPSDVFGSILRIDPNGDDFPGDPTRNYAIPPGNLAVPGAIPELYVYGVRNPYRDSVAPDGNLIIADVGQDNREEITVLSPGDVNRNLGWSLREGDIATPLVGGALPADDHEPQFVYDHLAGDKAVIGGYVYEGSAVPELFGRYVFGDEVSGNIWSIAYDGSDLLDGTLQLIGNIPGLSSFGETVDGELLATQYQVSGVGSAFIFTSDGIRTGPGSAVPEPATWLAMLVGLGTCGAALRRRAGAIARSGVRPAPGSEG